MKKLVIIGASGHGKVVADVAVLNGYEAIVFLDDNADIKGVDQYPVVGPTNATEELALAGYDFFVAIGNPVIRKRFIKQLIKEGKGIATLVHPLTAIARDVKIGIGTVIMAGAVINSDTVIGEGCIINTSASVDHDNRIGDYVHISVGAHTAGTVTIGEYSAVCVGASVVNNISICAEATVGAGAVVVKDIEAPGTYIGVPAKHKK